MPKLNHKQKIKLARSMMSPTEIKREAPVFETVRWDKRRNKNLRKQMNQGKRKAENAD